MSQSDDSKKGLKTWLKHLFNKKEDSLPTSYQAEAQKIYGVGQLIDESWARGPSVVQTKDKKKDGKKSGPIAVTPPHSSSGSASPSLQASVRSSSSSRISRLLSSDFIQLSDLAQRAWSGCTISLRPFVYRLLLKVSSPYRSRRRAAIRQKRSKYINTVNKLLPTYPCGTAAFPSDTKAIPGNLSPSDVKNLGQILRDLPRHRLDVMAASTPHIQAMMGRMLFVLSRERSSCGYVQGMNDIALLILSVFLGEQCGVCDDDNEFICLPGCEEMVASLSRKARENAESDAFLCFYSLVGELSGLFKHRQPGIHAALTNIENCLKLIDPELSCVLTESGVMPVTYAVSWIVCLLSRQLSVPLAIRLLDTYITESVLGAGKKKPSNPTISAVTGSTLIPSSSTSSSTSTSKYSAVEKESLDKETSIPPPLPSSSTGTKKKKRRRKDSDSAECESYDHEQPIKPHDQVSYGCGSSVATPLSASSSSPNPTCVVTPKPVRYECSNIEYLHIYVCCTLLKNMRDSLIYAAKEEHSLLLSVLHNPIECPDWPKTIKQLEEVLASAFILYEQFESAMSRK
ncbi:hypothetical protein ADUPG1_008429 [Aduncisulcus paluster]|uniref:Rab-GAP TBC domain-containing protein n=1 Tax=Aduncisulcus paluster TaxID=2918883 RepID=A0ABQ5KUX0_9EUKA|nr:hypothetical protein ADUPG1_008429 [Aduncisulcus paluster]